MLRKSSSHKRSSSKSSRKSSRRSSRRVSRRRKTPGHSKAHVGTKDQVWSGEKLYTSGGIRKSGLKINSRGRVVSKAMSLNAKRHNNLGKYKIGTRKSSRRVRKSSRKTRSPRKTKVCRRVSGSKKSCYLRKKHNSKHSSHKSPRKTRVCRKVKGSSSKSCFLRKKHNSKHSRRSPRRSSRRTRRRSSRKSSRRTRKH